MAAGYVVPLPQRLFDANGLPAVGWKVYTWTSTGGTFVTPLTTYSDAALTTPNTNPIISDASGYFRLFLAAGTMMDMQVKNAAGTQQFTFLGINPALTGATGATGAAGPAPAGCCIWSPYSTTPSGYLPCNGAAVSRATYSALNTLAAADSYPNGSGNGTTTFNVPDLRGRSAYGLAASGTGSTLGGTFGSMDHTHTGPSHTHASQVTVAAHTHTVGITVATHTHAVVVTRDGWGAVLDTPAVTGRLNTGSAAGTGQFSSAYEPTTDLTVTSAAGGAISQTPTSSSSGAIDQSVTSAAGGTGATGTGNAPGLAGYWYIKT